MLTVFLPCRKGSQRVPDKNIRPFAGYPHGLIEIKLKQLLACTRIDTILLSSNDERILDFAAGYAEERLSIDHRPDWLGSSDTTTDQLIQYVPSVIAEGDILWTHVTSPFMDEAQYDHMIDLYYRNLSKGYDSLMTAKVIYGFLWNKTGPINYLREQEKWPRTQTLQPIYEIDSGAFIAHRDTYQNLQDRVGRNPYLYEQDKIHSVDIDWPEDFEFAENLWNKQYTR